MSSFPKLTYFWPGLPQIIRRGTWTAVFWALVTAFLADCVIVTRFIWPETFTEFWDTIILAAFIGIYAVGCIVSYELDRDVQHSDKPSPSSDNFADAQLLYLKGKYFESEQILNQQLRQNPEDIPSRILLMDLLIVNRRLDEAQNQLVATLEFPQAATWKWELMALNDHIKEIANESNAL